MDMKNFLAGIGSGVDDHPVATKLDPLEPGDGRGFDQGPAQEVALFLSGFFQAGQVFLGDNQGVDRCLRSDVVESQNLFVFVDNPWPVFLC